jgi:dTDP-4-dehydrorhamnose reductase
VRALVFGAGGMLGRALIEELGRRGAQAHPVLHAEVDIADWFDVSRVIGTLHNQDEVDVIFNAAGVLNTGVDPIKMVQANALGPHVVATAAGFYGIPVIHVSTDCVFSGGWHPSRRAYSTKDFPDPIDLYGRTKLVGEASGDHVTNVRTSFVGPDHGLWAWVMEQARAGALVEGWTEALWSGSTVWAVAEGLVKLAELGALGGIIHLATEKPITKYEAIQRIAHHEGVPLEVLESKRIVIDRTLYPTYRLESFEAALARRHS